jgi:hypothetical protein
VTRANVATLWRYHELLSETGEAPVELLDPDVEIHMFRGSPIAGPYLGHDGVRQWMRDTFDVIEAWRLELDDGRIVRFEGHRERDEAVTAAGIAA